MKDIGDVKVGDELTVFSRETGLENWNRFAAVNDEFVPIHMDDQAGQAAGYPAAFGMGNLQWAYFHNALRAWLDGRGEIRSLSCQFRSPNLKGMTISVKGRVTEVVPGDEGLLVTFDLHTESEDGSTLAPAKAVVVLSNAAR
jgi:acyl dehydratase